MQAISHRGLWRSRAERNTLRAFEQSFAAGFAAEVDVRDLDGELVVSHDPPRRGALTFETVVAAHREAGSPGTLAVNVKADGLGQALLEILEGTPRWFAFDMSVPDAVQYARSGVPFFARQSEHEVVPSLLGQARGVWIDCFESDWIDESTIQDHVTAGRLVCLVSPELHGRPHEHEWTRWSSWPVMALTAVHVCTDLPHELNEVWA